MIGQLTPVELARWRVDPSREPPFVLDVREPWEISKCRLEPSHAVPMSSLPLALDALPRDRPIVLLCHHGVRSMHAAAWLARNGFTQLHNLRGGIAAWADQVEPAMPRY